LEGNRNEKERKKGREEGGGAFTLNGKAKKRYRKVRKKGNDTRMKTNGGMSRSKKSRVIFDPEGLNGTRSSVMFYELTITRER
jgi:hypothetical protein